MDATRTDSLSGGSLGRPLIRLKPQERVPLSSGWSKGALKALQAEHPRAERGRNDAGYFSVLSIRLISSDECSPASSVPGIKCLPISRSPTSTGS